MQSATIGPTERKEEKAGVITGGLHDPSMWTPYQVTLNFVGRLCGSVPASKDLIEAWLRSREPSVKPPSAKTIPETAEEVINRLPDMGQENAEIEQRTMIVFERVEGRLAVRAATIRAHLKDCCSQVQNQLVGRIKGERNFTTRVKNGLYIGGGFRDQNGTEMLFLLKGGQPVTEADGFQERLVHAKTPQGQINAIKRFEYVIQPTISFTAFLLGNSVKSEDMAVILRYGAVHGYGGERSQQEGQYAFQIAISAEKEAKKKDEQAVYPA
ncbi:MAG: hypothetical protein HY401_04215 [Elusimicrobia bacterium]|nr:hypothetical protein [Elusimicrobiota bacterium]